jgi:Predicted transcriptional regulators
MKVYINDILKEKNMTVEQLSDMSGVSVAQIDNICCGRYIGCGRNHPTIEAVCKLARALNVPGIELFSYED